MFQKSDQAQFDTAAHALNERSRELIAIVVELMRELYPRRSKFINIELSSRIERDLGIDSLGRIELIMRIEQAFRVRLPAQMIGEAETIDDLLHALQKAGSARARASPKTLSTPVLPSVPSASEAQTLMEVLEWHTERHPGRQHLCLLQDEATVLDALTYAELATKAKDVARGLVARDVSVGERVALMLPTSIDFFIAFFGILYAGAIPVPIYPPMRLSQLEEHLRRQVGILRNAGACLLITMPEGRQLAGLLSPQVESLKHVVSVKDLISLTDQISLPRVHKTDSIALIQYTSGSTGDPKGVVLSHANLLANIRALGVVMNANSDDVFVSWLPLYHDMGLIGAWLGCLYFAAPFYVMSPLSFLVRPESWLWAMHRYRATLSAAPNFAFELCVSKIAEAELEGLNLASLRIVANGAEPVSPNTLRRFIERFGRYGLSATAMTPVYGLAECSVGLTFPSLGRGPIIDRVDRDKLSSEGVAEPARPDDPKPLEIVACGEPLPGHEVRIVDEAGLELGDRREGRLEFRGPSATSGYFNNESKTRELFRDDWLDSGDRAYMAGGDVCITGRIKDIIIRAGRHLYPQEIEEAVSEIPGTRSGGVAVFSVSDPSAGTERVIVLAETQEAIPETRAKLQALIQEVVTDAAGTPPDEIILVSPYSVPKTSSGKIRRSAAKQLYSNRRLGAPSSALWLQLFRLRLASLVSRFGGWTRLLHDMLYAAWWWIVVATSFTLAWFGVILLPRRLWRWSVIRAIARGALAAIGIPTVVTGLERIPSGRAVLIFNHASYMDAFVLSAFLPGEPVFVAKHELAGQIFAGPFLRRLGALFVERYDVGASLADTAAVITAAEQGRIIVFFPEGTFTRRPGLSEFYLGAFKVAAQAGLPVFPGIISGTRAMLRSDQWFPRWAQLSIRIEEPIKPSGTDFASLVHLRDAVRGVVLSHCGEPDIAELVKPPLAAA